MQSLKRVKISTSPGELRLISDLELLVKSERWHANTNNNNQYHHQQHHQGSSSSWDRPGNNNSRLHGELYCHNARLVRDPVDPLRLRLTYLHQPTSSSSACASQNNIDTRYLSLSSSSSSSSSPIPPERWTFLIQLQRMYPHFPPSITRVMRDSCENDSPLGNSNIMNVGDYNNGTTNYNYYNSAAAAAIVASSSMQNQLEPPVPETVLINPLPPTPTSISNNNVNQSKLLDIDLHTSVCNTWTPVSSLQDLLDFLLQIPTKRKEWWSIENNRRHHYEQQRLLNHHHGIGALVQPTITPSFNSFTHFQHHNQHQQQQQQQHQQQQQQQHQHQHQHQFTLSHNNAMNHGGGMQAAAQQSMMMLEDADRLRPEKVLPVNRFDIGYDRTRQRDMSMH